MKEKIPCVSVIVPVYNVEKYLDQCVCSLLHQTLRNVEIILVDDGSTDSSGKICDKYANQYTRVKVIHQENGGLGLARNSGLEIASGEYIGFVDSDDFVFVDMFQRLYNHAKKYNADISYGKSKRFIHEKEVVNFVPDESETKLWNEKEIRNYLLDRIGLPPVFTEDNFFGASVCLGIFKHSIIKENKLCFVSERQFIAEDIIFDIDIIPYCERIVHCEDQLYFYRYNPVSLTTSYNPERFDKNVILYHEMYRRLLDNYKSEECFNSMSRYFLTFTRVAIIQEIVHLKRNGYVKARKQVKKICCNSELCRILDKYEYKKLPLKLKIYCMCEKYKLVDFLLGMTCLNQRMKGKDYGSNT